jgi:NADH-quinone oxidoreductase subunit L
LYRGETTRRAQLAETSGYAGLRRFLFSGLGFDWAYDWLLVRPYKRISNFIRRDFFDYVYKGIGLLNIGFNLVFSGAQTGKVRWYLAGIGFGTVVAIGVMILL